MVGRSPGAFLAPTVSPHFRVQLIEDGLPGTADPRVGQYEAAAMGAGGGRLHESEYHSTFLSILGQLV